MAFYNDLLYSIISAVLHDFHVRGVDRLPESSHQIRVVNVKILADAKVMFRIGYFIYRMADAESKFEWQE